MPRSRRGCARPPPLESSTPSEARRVEILGCGVDPVDLGAAVARIQALLAACRPAQVVTLGAEMVMHAQRDAKYRAVINSADLVVPDTVGMIWASRRLGRPLPECVPGIELAERLAASADAPVYFLGAAAGVASEAAQALSERYPRMRIAGTHDGYFSETDSAEIAAAIRASGARLVLVALGFPRQEFWIRDNLSTLGAVVGIGVGGAFDVWAGKAKRAPEGVRRLGLEWLYRLVTQPSRLGRQLALPAFAFKVLVAARRPASHSIG
jgi:N-acetylglucosaminyldiphosphoundecaprenol N-acetyl-beta-D-mannosaminyltransferase